MDVQGGLRVGLKIETPQEEQVPAFYVLLLIIALILLVLTLGILTVEFFNLSVPFLISK